MKLEQFKTEDGIELYIDQETGASFASQRGYARMSNVAISTLRDRLSTMRKIDPENAKTLTMTTSEIERKYMMASDKITPENVKTLDTSVLELRTTNLIHSC